MILLCPSCNSKYVVNPSAIGKVGRIVRCASCGHSWFQSAAEEETKPEIAVEQAPELPSPKKLERENQRPRPIPEGSGLPVPSKGLPPPMGLKILVGVLAAAVVVFGIFVFRAPIIAMAPGLKAAYDKAGMQETKGIALADIKYKTLASSKKIKVTIDGTIINESDHEITIPALRFRPLDEVGHALVYPGGEHKGDAVQYVVDGHGKVLKPGETVPISDIEIDNIPKAVTSVQMDLGSSYELWLRD